MVSFFDESLLPFFLVGFTILSAWLQSRKPFWLLFCLSLIFAFWNKNISVFGVIIILGFVILWVNYKKHPNYWLFWTIVVFSVSLKLHLLPGFKPFHITSKFALSFDSPLVGLMPLVFAVPLSRNYQEWKKVFKGVGVGLLGIGLLAFLAVAFHATKWSYGIPSNFSLRVFSTAVLTAVTEEAFFRGFVQKKLFSTFLFLRFGKLLALLLTSVLFAIIHIYWSPNITILLFTFFAGIFYGAVYWFSGRIESSIIIHALLNTVHMIFFQYHAI